MNKLFIFMLLAVCLVSVQAFVKRDAPADATKQDGGLDFKKDFNDLLNKIQESVKPDKIQAAFEQMGASVKDVISKLSPSEAPKA